MEKKPHEFTRETAFSQNISENLIAFQKNNTNNIKGLNLIKNCIQIKVLVLRNTFSPPIRLASNLQQLFLYPNINTLNIK